MFRFSGTPPTILSGRKRQIDFIVEVWNDFRTCDDHGATTWEVLESLERAVTDCLACDPPRIDEAEGLTCQAMLLMTGQMER